MPPPDPLSYNMSDVNPTLLNVNPHLTRCEPPPYLKAGSAPAFQYNCSVTKRDHLGNVYRQCIKYLYLHLLRHTLGHA